MPSLRPVVSSVDRWQQRTPVAGVAYAVVRKFSDDDAKLLAVALAWYGFTAVYPLLLVAVTVLGYVGADSLGHGVIDTLHQFPVIGSDFNPAHGSAQLHGSPWAAAIGIAGLLYGAQGVTQTAENTMARVWNTPRVQLPGFAPRLARSMVGLLIIASAFVVNAFVGAVATAQHATAVRVGCFVALGIANVALYFAAFWVLTPRFRRRRDLLPGAVVAGVGFTLLTSVGTGLVEHQLRNSSNTYGAFASVIGVVTYLLLLATITLYAAELNPVLALRLWPRALPGTPPARADDEVLRLRAHEERRRDDERVGVGFDPGAIDEAAADAACEATPHA